MPPVWRALLHYTLDGLPVRITTTLSFLSATRTQKVLLVFVLWILLLHKKFHYPIRKFILKTPLHLNQHNITRASPVCLCDLAHKAWDLHLHHAWQYQGATTSPWLNQLLIVDVKCISNNVLKGMQLYQNFEKMVISYFSKWRGYLDIKNDLDLIMAHGRSCTVDYTGFH